MATSRLANRTAAVFLAGGLAVSFAAAALATTSSPSPMDSSSAVRYSTTNRIIGNLIVEMIDADGRAKAIDLPFPVNVYGQKYPSLCIGTDGAVMPVASTSASCYNNSYDKPVALIAAQAPNPVIVALGIDTDPGENIHNPHRESLTELAVASYEVDGSAVMTVVTTEPHGFVVGDLVRGGGTDRPDEVIVTEVVSPTSYKGEGPSDPLDPASFTAIAGTRTVVYREVVMHRISDGSVSISGSTLEFVNDSREPWIGTGRTITVAKSGIPGLDGADLQVLSRTGNTVVTNLPAGLVDVDPTQAGNQTSFVLSSAELWLLERDAVGAIQQVSVGTTTLDGRDAVVITWYRVATNDESSSSPPPAINPETLTNTFQMVLLKRGTGSDSTGWDFDVEYNFGHANDTSDGHKTGEPTSSCRPAEPETCVWPAGMGRPLRTVVSSYAVTSSDITLNTATAHGISAGDLVDVGNLYGQTYLFGARQVASVVDSDTVTFVNEYSAPDAPETSAPVDASLARGEACELFPDNTALQLGDKGGATALVRNSLNTDLPGRYTFGVVAGLPVGCMKPVMGNGATYAPEFTPTTTTSPTTTTGQSTTTSIKDDDRDPGATATGGSLPRTGADALALLQWGVLVALAGLSCLVAHRRLRH